MSQKEIRALAFYLPQYHPIPENDKWWGKGFTEWRNVTKAKPLFPGHYQPHLPADLGFYDLRLPEAREAQAELAREYGIYGFCYYHYWFNGKRLLERPFNEVLSSGKPDFPFCLCWANENWTRIWDGQDREVLIGQEYSEEDDRQHIKWLVSAFKDERYITIDGKPVFLVYRAGKLPDPMKTSSIWREEARRLGVGDIYLCRVVNFPDERTDPSSIGFDASVEFQPNGFTAGTPLRSRQRSWFGLKFIRKNDSIYEQNSIYDYSTLVERAIREEKPPYTRFPCVTPMWDNFPRRTEGASIFLNSTPELYEKWLRFVVRNFVQNDSEQNLVFINAWNEWAEGNHLEPCLRWGRAYLEATRRALNVTG